MHCNSYWIQDIRRDKQDEDGYTYNNISCQITKISDKITYMTNGLKYYFVEVTCSDGIQYGIQAYGDEAEDLYKEARKYFDYEKASEVNKILC